MPTKEGTTIFKTFNTNDIFDGQTVTAGEKLIAVLSHRSAVPTTNPPTLSFAGESFAIPTNGSWENLPLDGTYRISAYAFYLEAASTHATGTYSSSLTGESIAWDLVVLRFSNDLPALKEIYWDSSGSTADSTSLALTSTSSHAANTTRVGFGIVKKATGDPVGATYVYDTLGNEEQDTEGNFGIEAMSAYLIEDAVAGSKTDTFSFTGTTTANTAIIAGVLAFEPAVAGATNPGGNRQLDATHPLFAKVGAFWVLTGDMDSNVSNARLRDLKSGTELALPSGWTAVDDPTYGWLLQGDETQAAFSFDESLLTGISYTDEVQWLAVAESDTDNATGVTDGNYLATSFGGGNLALSEWERNQTANRMTFRLNGDSGLLTVDPWDQMNVLSISKRTTAGQRAIINGTENAYDTGNVAAPEQLANPVNIGFHWGGKFLGLIIFNSELSTAENATWSDPHLINEMHEAATADVTAPTVQSAAVNAAGDALTITLDENVQVGAGGNGGFTTNLSGVTLAFSSISGADVILTPSRTILQSESLTVSYVQPTDGIQDTASTPNDLASFSGQAVTNNSTQTPPSFSASTLDDTVRVGETWVVALVGATNAAGKTARDANNVPVGVLSQTIDEIQLVAYDPTTHGDQTKQYNVASTITIDDDGDTTTIDLIVEPEPDHQLVTVSGWTFDNRTPPADWLSLADPSGNTDWNGGTMYTEIDSAEAVQRADGGIDGLDPSSQFYVNLYYDGEWQGRTLIEAASLAATIFNIEAAPLTFTGNDVSLSGGSAAFNIEAAPLAFTGEDLSLDLAGGVIFTIEPSSMSFSGDDIALDILADFTISPRPMIFTGQSLDIVLIASLPQNPVGGGRRSTVR